MSLSQSPAVKPGAAHSAIPRMHIVSEVCPTCEQPIPHDRFEEIKDRIEARQSGRETQITARLMEEFGRQKAEAVEQARQEVTATVAAQVASAREEERQTAEAAANQKLAEAERINKGALASMGSRVEQAEAAKSDAQAQIAQVRHESAATIQKMKEDAEARETAIRDEAQIQAEAAVREKLAGMERSRQESEAALQARVKEAVDAKIAAQQSNTALQDQLIQARADGTAAVEKAKQDADARVNAARQEATVAAETAMQKKVTGAEHARAELEAKLLATEQQKRELQESHNTQLEQRLQEQREALSKDKDKAILDTEARTFAERQRLQVSVQDLSRQIEKLTAHERGEGAEIDLFEALKSTFEGDRIRRVKPGVAGPDIIHEIVRHGKVCGTIIYETKNRNDYKTAYATKLRGDQMAAKAEFAVLSSNHFPGKARQLHIHEGVIVACPARVVTLAQMLRRHLLQLHELRISIQERGAKTEKLYKFIASDQCRQLLDSVEKLVDDMLELDVKEQSAHKTIWEKRGRMLNLVLKAHGDFCSALDRIIGTAD
jgi:hypothetical protein